MDNVYSIVIVGGGVAAASVVYHLYSNKNFKGKVILQESGLIGKGVDSNNKTNTDVKNHLGEESIYSPWYSGSNVFDKPNRIKMIVTCFATTAKDFSRHHGMKGVELYNKLASFGRDEEIRIAETLVNKDKILSDQTGNISDELGCIRLGSLMVCSEVEVEELKEEYEILKKGGFECEWWDKNKVDKLHGKAANFHAGIFFPKDGIIDSSTYSQKLVEFATKFGLEVREKTRVANVKDISREKNGNKEKLVKVTLANNEVILAKNVVIATGGLYLDKNLAGFLRPCYSYLSGIKSNVNYTNKPTSNQSQTTLDNIKNSPNFFTYGFTHDWSMSQGYLRISGEDHFCALKNPRTKLRCNNLEQWALEKYPFLKNNLKPELNHYLNGVYSETPDYIPVLGNVSDNSRIFYIVGCNAWGQAILSAAAFLMPALLGERSLTKEEQELVDFLSIRRFNSQNYFGDKTQSKTIPNPKF